MFSLINWCTGKMTFHTREKQTQKSAWKIEKGSYHLMMTGCKGSQRTHSFSPGIQSIQLADKRFLNYRLTPISLAGDRPLGSGCWILGSGTVDFSPAGLGRINCDLTTSSCDRHSATWSNTDIQSRATTISHLGTVREGRKRAWQQIYSRAYLFWGPLPTGFRRYILSRLSSLATDLWLLN